MSLVPIPSEPGGSTCANCGAALVADQRYCLSCGQPASPVRLAFLDALQGQGAGAGVAQTIEMSPAGYVAVADSRGANGWLRRNSGLLGLLAVLVLCLIAGLLVGHWVSQGGTKVPAKQVVEVKGLSGLAAAPAAAAATTTSTPATTAPAEQKESAAAKAAAAKAEAKLTKAEKAPPAKPKKVAPTQIKKLTQSSGKQHQEEINALGNGPIETG
jgi:hypothetical protein